MVVLRELIREVKDFTIVEHTMQAGSFHACSRISKTGSGGVELEHAWEFLSDKQFLRSVQKRLPKVYLENIDPFAWESYKNGLAAEKRSKQMDISSMFNLDDIDEPEWANLNERIGDAVWNVDPD
jgi:hypothetical protein